MKQNPMMLLSAVLLLFTIASCRDRCAIDAYISTSEGSQFALIGVESECPFDVFLGDEIENDVDRISYQAGRARLKLTVKSDEIKVVDLDRDERAVILHAPPNVNFERVQKPPPRKGVRDHRSIQWEVASAGGIDGMGAILFTILVSES